MNWNEVQAFFRGTYHLVADEPQWLSLDFMFETKRLQRIVVSTFEALNTSWIIFRSRICRAGQMTAEQACRKTSGFAVGAIGLVGEGDLAWYEMIYSTMLPVHEDHIDLMLHTIAQTADELEAEFTNGDDIA